MQTKLGLPAGTALRDAWTRGQELTIHSWIYGLRDGLLRDLNMTVSKPGDTLPAYTAAVGAITGKASTSVPW